MTTIDSDRNQLLRQALAPDAGCPPLAELLDVVVAGAANPRAESLRAHAAACSVCSAELALAGAFDETARSPAEAQEIAWVVEQLASPSASSARSSTPTTPTMPTTSGVTPQMGRVLPMAEHAARRRKSKSPGEAREMSLWNRWAAAALVIVGLGVAFEWAHRTIGGAPATSPRPGSFDSDVVRGGAIVLDSPLGRQARAVSEFAWRALPGAASYRLEVREAAGDLLWQGSAVGVRLETPADLAAKLETYVAYTWNVTALDAAQSAVGQSQSARFVVEPALDPASNPLPSPLPN